MIARREKTTREPNGKWRPSYIRCGTCGKGLIKYGEKKSYRCRNGHLTGIHRENLGYYIEENMILNDEDITKSCYLRADYLTYQELYAKLLAGPSSRGQKRAIYYLEDGSEADRYGSVLEALRRDPPLKTITISEIYERAKGIFDKKKSIPKLTTQTIKNTMKSMFSILEESGRKRT